jgi:hypothetical protein
MNGIQADEIYAFYRTPHHTGIFKSLDYFYHEHLNGVLAFVFSLLFVIVVYKNTDTEKIALSRLLIALGILLGINLIVAAFDKHGHFVKYYPFRMTALFSFLFYMYALALLIKAETIQIVKTWSLVLILTFGTIHGALVFYKSMIKKEAYTDFVATTSFIKNNTPKTSVFFYHTNNDDYTLQFTRLSERERYVVFKFAPAGTNKLFEWYRRMNVADEILAKPELIFEELKNVPIDFYLSETEIDNQKFNLVYSNNHYNLYSLSK